MTQWPHTQPSKAIWDSVSSPQHADWRSQRPLLISEWPKTIAAEESVDQSLLFILLVILWPLSITVKSVWKVCYIFLKSFFKSMQGTLRVPNCAQYWRVSLHGRWEEVKCCPLFFWSMWSELHTDFTNTLRGLEQIYVWYIVPHILYNNILICSILESVPSYLV